jgi:hypothetical protein
MWWPLTSKMQLSRANDEEVNFWRVGGGPYDVYDDDNEEMSRLIDSLSLALSTSSSNCNRQQQRIYFKCNNQANCRELQNIFESNPSLIKTHFKSILYYSGDMILDGFGNFLLTTILEKCDALQRYVIINRLGSSILKASMTLSGSRCVQNLIDLSKDDERTITLIWKLLKPEVESLAIHLYGNHCLQKLLGTKKVFCFPDLIHAIIENFKPVCLNRYGSYVIQRCFDLVCETHPIFRLEMVAKLSQDFLELSTTRVGNYTAQYLISKMPAIDLDLLISSLEGNVVRLSCDPFGSNVLESLFMRNENTVCIGYIVEEMISNHMKLFKIIGDRYGQYCIVKAIKELDVSEKGRLLSKAIVDITPLFEGTIREKRVIKTLHEIWFH